MAAYDTQDEDNFYHHHRSHPIDISKIVVVEHEQNSNSISRITPSKLNFLKEQTLSNSNNSTTSSNKNRSKGNNQLYLIFLPLFICGFMLYRYSTFEFKQQSFDAIRFRHSNGRSLLQFIEQKEQIMTNVYSRDSTWPISDKLSIGGYILGWIAAVLSILARIPQILKNKRRKSTDGLSVYMFLLLILGNFTFCLSVLLFCSQPYIILLRLPWAFSALGSILLDIVVCILIL